MPVLIDLSGERFGRLQVVSKYLGKEFSGSTRWICRCDCGAELLVRSRSLREKNTQSCGCLRRDTTSQMRYQHGYSGHPLYSLWNSMIGRCRALGNSSYERYGARGITVCERWLKFENFLADMGERPEGLTLDRIDNNGPYSPENCRWTDVRTQLRNRRTSRFLTYQRKTQTYTEWDRELGFSLGTIHNRLKLFNGDLEKVMHVGPFPGRRGRGRKFLSASSETAGS